MNINNLKIYKNALDIKKYKLVNNIKVNYMIYEPDILPNSITIDNDIAIHKNLKKYVDILKETFPKEYLIVLFNNLKNIKYNVSLDNDEILRSIIGIIIGTGPTEGYYSPYRNEITTISKKQNQVFSFLMHDELTSYETTINNILSHEIFHVATSTFKNNIEFCGFYQNYRLYDIGNGINEGYTELLARRYFNKDRGYYDDEVLIALLIEEIIGNSQMLDVYFHMNLNGLIYLLTEYSNIYMAKRFILNLDKYCQKPTDKLMEDILLFIINLNRNKLIKNTSLTTLEINNQINEYNNRILSYINNEKNKYKIKKAI